MSVYIFQSLKLRKSEQNDVARKFFKFLDGFGINRSYRCLICGTIVNAPSPRLAALYHHEKHPEIVNAFQKVGLFEVWFLGER